MALRRELTPKEQREWLRVPSLEGDNLFTGRNEFEGTTQIRGALEITLQGSDAFNVIDSSSAINVLDFSASNGATYSLPTGGGTVAMVGGALTLPYRAVTGTYTVVLTDGLIACDGTFTVTLPAAASCAGQLFILKNAGAGVITLDGDGAETIDGAATATAAAGVALRVASNGSNWILV